MVSEETTGVPPEENLDQAEALEQEATPEQAEIARLQAALDEQTAQAKEYLDQWKRAAADFANLRKRQAKEQEEMRQWANARLIQDLLPVLDDLDLALKTLNDQELKNDWAQGVQLVAHKMRTTLERSGVQEITVELGTPFDPAVHEAIFYEETTNIPEGSVSEVIRQGYKLGDRVLRPAMVKVAKAP
jgi:molecular chaperone GrpE